MTMSGTGAHTVEPELPIIDAHHHLWDTPHPTYLFEEYREDLETGHNVVATVFVEGTSMYRSEGPEALRPLGEVEYANGVAAMSASGLYGQTQIARGIVGFADLLLGKQVMPVLEHMKEAAHERFRGIRYITAYDEQVALKAPKDVMQDPRFREGFECLGPMGLTFDAWQYHPQLPALYAFLQRSSRETRVVINHVGGRVGIGTYADSLESAESDWRRSLTKLATLPNVYLKLSGLNMPLAALSHTSSPEKLPLETLVSLWSPSIELGIELFGPERCMFASNFPVDNTGTNYHDLWNAFKIISAAFSDTERSDLFRGTAARFYGLDELIP